MAAVYRGKSSAGTRCSVPRMSHVLARVLRFHNAVANVLDLAIDADGGRQLRCRHHLSLQAADLTYDSSQVLLRGPPYQVVALE